MKYVSEKYQKQLEDLAEHLVQRRQLDAPEVGQMALFNVVELRPMAEVIPLWPEAANDGIA
jgi:hypothetical protein